MVLICISLTISKAEYLIICLLIIFFFFFEEFLFRSSAIFQLGCFIFCYWVVWVVYIFWQLNPFWSHYLQYFLPFLAIFSILFTVPFAVQKFISLIRSILFIFYFHSIAFRDWPMKTLVQFISENCLHLLSSRNFTMSCVTFTFLSNFEFIFVYGVRKCSNFINLHGDVYLFQHYLVKRLFHLLFIPASFIED